MASRGAKSRSHNVNSVYNGKSTTSGRAAGPLSKHGLQQLGKSSTVVRRMPPPATLPSLKAEHGHDPVVLVPQGSQGWNKPQADVSANDSKNHVTENAVATASSGPDLRPNWAKSSPAPAGTQQVGDSTVKPAVPQTVQLQRPKMPLASANNREFPTLAASVAAASSKQPTGGSLSSTEVSKTQNSTSSLTRSDAQSMYAPSVREEAVIPCAPPPTAGSGYYIGASTGPRNNVDRQLPERYYGGVQEARATGTRRYDLRQKLAQLSMESKEPATPTEKQSAERQLSGPPLSEDPARPSAETRASVSPVAPPPQTLAAHPPASTSLVQSQSLPSQDVRQYYPQQHPTAPSEESAWNRNTGVVPASGYDPIQELSTFRGDLPAPSHQTQQSHGRVDAGPVHGAPGLRAGRQPRSRFDYADEQPNSHRYSGGSWDEPFHPTGQPHWPLDERSGPIQRQQRARGSFRGGESRGTSESDSAWLSGVPTARRNDQNGWNYALTEEPLARFDAQPYGPPPTQRTGNSNRSRTTSNSYGDDYEIGIYGRSYGESERRNKRRADPADGFGDYTSEYADLYDRQKFQEVQQPPTQQPPFRMLKRNDEKSAEYFAKHGGGPLMEAALGTGGDELHGQLTNRSPKGAIFDLTDNAETPDQPTGEVAKLPGGKFNRAPGSNKPTAKNSTQRMGSVEAASQSTKPSVTPENVWKKRAEEHRQIHQEQEEKVKWQSSRQPRKLDNLPTISGDGKGDQVGGFDSIPLDSSVGQQQEHRSARTRPNERRGTSKTDEKQPTASWGEEPERSNAGDGESEDTYEGTRREFYNRQRTRPQQPRTQPTRVSKSRDQKDQQSEVTTRQPVSSQLLNRGRKSNEPKDNFSNMGEFHAEDYKIEEVRSFVPPPISQTFDDVGFHVSTENTTREDEQQVGRTNRRAPTKRAPETDENRQSKPQRQATSRAWQRQRKPTETADGQNGDPISESDGGRTQRAAKLRAQRPDPNPSRQQNSNVRRAAGGREPKKTLAPVQPDANKTTKSSARSENGVDEGDTESDTSHRRPRGSRLDREKTPTNGTTKSGLTAKTQHAADPPQPPQRLNTGQKNAQPVSHTCHQSNGAFVKNNNVQNNEQPTQKPNGQQKQPNARERTSTNAHANRKNARDNRGHSSVPASTTNGDVWGGGTTAVRNGLAGVDLNDASVVIIDNQPDVDEWSGNSETDEFEEVLSRKSRRQRQQLKQQEEERVQRERQKAETRRQRQKDEKQQRRNGKRNGKHSESAVHEPRNSSAPPSEGSKQPSSSLSPLSASAVSSLQSTTHEKTDISVHTTRNVVWNSPHVMSTTAEDLTAGPMVMPSPIARPTPKNKIDLDSKFQPQNTVDFASFSPKADGETAKCSFGYEPSTTIADELPSTLKNFWQGDLSDEIFGNTNSSRSSTQPLLPDSLADLSLRAEEPNRNKSQPSTCHFSNSQPALSTAAQMIFGNAATSAYPISSGGPFNAGSGYSLLFNGGRDFLPSQSFSQPPPTSQPMAAQNFGVESRGLVDSIKLFNGPLTRTTDWPTGNTDLLHSSSTSPLHGPNLFGAPSGAPQRFPQSTNFNSPALPLNNHSVPPPAIGKFAPNFPPPNFIPTPPQDFRFPPPSTATFAPGPANRNFSVSTSNRTAAAPQRRLQNGAYGPRQQNSSPMSPAGPPFGVVWNAKAGGQQPFGLF